MRKKGYIKFLKGCSFAALIISHSVLILFLLLGIILTIFFVQNLFLGFSGFAFTEILYLLIGMYLIYNPIKKIRSLISRRKSFNREFSEFVDKNEVELLITAPLAVILLLLFYTDLYLNLNFFVNIALYLPIFFINNLTFIINIFLLRHDLLSFSLMIELIKPIIEIIYLYNISLLIAKFLKKRIMK